MLLELWLGKPDQLTQPIARAAARALLDAGERATMDRYVFERDQTLFLAAHTLVRRALSQHAHVAPESWTFERAPNGRPLLVGPEPVPPLDFNLSHCHGLAACALTSAGVAIGVDVERIAALPANLIDDICSPREAAALRALGDTAQPERFFTLWTLKEAYAKARGLGLSLPLQQIEFEFDGEVPSFLPGPALEDRADAWRFERRKPTVDHCAAVCVSSDASDLPPLHVRWLDA